MQLNSKITVKFKNNINQFLKIQKIMQIQMQIVNNDREQQFSAPLPEVGAGLTATLGKSLGPKVKKKDLQLWAQTKIPGVTSASANAIGSLFFEIPTMEKEMWKMSKKIEDNALSLEDQSRNIQDLERFIQEIQTDYEGKHATYMALYGNDDPDHPLGDMQLTDKESKGFELRLIYARMEELRMELSKLIQDFQVNVAFAPIMQLRIIDDIKIYEEKKELIRFLGEKVTENETLKMKYAELTRLQAELETEKQEALANFQAQVDLTQAQINLNLQTTNEAQDQKTLSDNQIQALNKQIATVNAQLQVVQDQEAANQAQIGALNGQIAAVNAQLQAAQDQGLLDQAQIGALTGQVAAANAQLAKERQNKFGLLGAIGFGYVVSANPAVVATGTSLLLRQVGTEMTVAGLNQMVMGYGMPIAILAAGLIGYATSSYVGPWVADQVLKFINAVPAMSKTIFGLSKDMLIKSWKLLSAITNAILSFLKGTLIKSWALLSGVTNLTLSFLSLLKDMFIKAWEYRTALLTLLVVGYFAYNAEIEILSIARRQASLYCSDIFDGGVDGFSNFLQSIRDYFLAQ